MAGPASMSSANAESARRSEQKKRREKDLRPTTPTQKAEAQMTSARLVGITHDSEPEPWQTVSADIKTLPDAAVIYTRHHGFFTVPPPRVIRNINQRHSTS
ncbi:hypothetical protein CGRA01v4_00856 [Colletotrichum graminicola]|uniref:Uncharacterized protein n=1 Tax=Colletotrichum graminicola (strain M1.001 / M2 / FGSC 10212) TaxID=645133 RepID=E3QRD3_COLGM|nr:uncharacterized protein GLRG_08700 [Colletotrichum graminicola M1.001]EFQ33421.1 hypothetical protein GLRG_08700 [Colletotrichum graminicola M1.001]WDK09578.1 hypothetical protein CGRA01v4_00856 [Colletotrichum graminicola]